MPSADLPKPGDRPIRIRFFANRYDWMGPAIVVLSSWYFAAQVLVAWVFRPDYSFIVNGISDLGNTGCPPSGSDICSPRYWVMDASIALLGVAMIVGSVLIFSEFSFSHERRERAAAIAGFVCLGLGGLGAVLVGAVPENVNLDLHLVGAAMAIGLGQLAILILGLVLRYIDDWLREFMLVTSLFVVAIQPESGLQLWTLQIVRWRRAGSRPPGAMPERMATWTSVPPVTACAVTVG